MKLYFILLVFCLFCTSLVGAQESWSPEHVFYGKGGMLSYTPDEQGNIIPDFSNVGYKYGDEEIPDVQTVVEVSPVEGDDGATIQAAINSLYSITPDENGFRGAVLLKAGEYQVSGQIKIAASGIVLRGEGDIETGTVIIAEGTDRRDLITVDNGKSRNVISSTKVGIVEDYVPLGRKHVIVSNTSQYAVGDNIVLYRPGISRWIADLKMDQITPREGTVQWSPSSYSFYFERLVTKVNGDTIFFRNPVVMAIEKYYGGGAVYKYTFDRLQNVGIESILLKSEYAHDTDEEHSWNAIVIKSAENCWVRNVTTMHFAMSCVSLQNNSRLTTVINCHSKDQKSLIAGGRRYPFLINGGSLHLIKECTSSDGRHDYVTGSRVCGPNVFTQCTAVNTHADIGPHHRWAMGTLYDDIISEGPINVQDRDNAGSGHGWAGANQVFWNCKGSFSICQSPWVSAKNYNFGFIGDKKAGYQPDRPDGEWVGHNISGIFPTSLYEAQLDERQNGTVLFSAFSQLKIVNDTTFVMQFTLPLDSAQINNEYFKVLEPDSLEEKDYSVRQLDEFSVVISSAAFKSMESSFTLRVKANELISKEGKEIQGVKSATYKYMIKEKHPVVTGSSKVVDNINDFVEASSNMKGFVYLVKYGLNITMQAELDSLVSANLGSKREALVADSTIQIPTIGLPGDYYQYYAVSEENYISAPSSNYVIVQQNGPVIGIIHEIRDTPFYAWSSKGKITIEPGTNERYKLEIFSSSGNLLYKKEQVLGQQTVELYDTKGLFLVRKSTDTKTKVLKIVLQ